MYNQSEQTVLTTVEIGRNQEIISVDGKKGTSIKKCYEALFGRTTVCPGCPYRKIIKDKNTGSQLLYFKPQKELPKLQLELLPLVDSEGEVVVVRETISILENEPINYFHKGLIENLSERLFQSQEFPIEKRLLIAALRKCTKSQNLVLSQVAHQIQQPLSIIRGYVELALPSPSEEYKNIIDQELVNLMELTQKLLKFAQTEFGLQKLNLKKVEAVNFLHKIYHQFEQNNKTHKFDFQVPKGKKFFIKIDEKEFEDAIRILLENAFKYVPERRSIELGIKSRHDQFIIYVKDEGEGISDENKEKIFDHFFRGCEKSHGTGLGLWIAQNIIQQHGGRIEVQSKKGNGTQFAIELPLI